MRVPPDVARYLPDLAAAMPSAPRGLGRFWAIELSQREPSSVRPFAVPRVQGEVFVRDERTERAEVAPKAATLGTRPPAPEALSEPVRYAFVSGLETTQPHACTSCAPTAPGRQSCGVCGGASRFADPQPCKGCGGSGQIVCASCDGEREVVWARMVYGSYEKESLNRAFLPVALAGPIWAFRSRLEAMPSIEALRLPLQAKAGSGPYRDAPRAEDHFHGFGYADALTGARRFLERALGRAYHADLELTVVPVLEVTWRSFMRAHRALLHVGADGLPVWTSDEPS